MSGQTDDDRLYSEEEISSILRRSAKLQSETDTASTAGLTLEELKHVASEVGIDPVHVETASRDLEHGLTEDRDGPESLFMPTTSHYAHVVQGELRGGQWEDVVEAIRSEYGAFASVGQVGNQVTWTHSRFPEPAKQVSVASRDDRTRIVAHSDYSNLFAFIMPGLFASSAVVAAITLEGLGLPSSAAIMTLGLWVTLYYFFARSLFASLSRKENRRAKRLTKRIEGLVRTEPEQSAEVVSEGMLADGILDEEEEALEHKQARRDRSRT